MSATTAIDPLERVLSRLSNVRRTGSGWTARCPSHDDQRNSLSIAVGQDRHVLVHCHAGCPTERIVGALGLTMAGLFPPRAGVITSNGHGRRIVATYDYLDEAGTLLYQVLRFEPKGFSQRRPDGRGGWTWNLECVRRVLYRLPQLLAADPAVTVLIGEGEQDVDRLVALGFVATTNAGGAGKWRPEFREPFRGRHVCILPDHDEPGEKHAADVAHSLTGIAADVRVLHLPGLPPKGDVSDWLRTGGRPDDLRRMIDTAPVWEPSETSCPNDHGREPVGVLASDVVPERVTWLSPGRLAAGKCTILDGDPELGKSTLSLELAARITRGDALPGGQPGAPRGVVVLSAEDGIADTIVPRLIAAGADASRVFIMTGIRAADGGEDAVTVPGGLDVVEQAIRQDDAALLIVDPLVAFLGSDVNSNRDQDVRRAMAPLAAMLERTGCAGLLLRHLNKALGGQALYRGGGSIGIIGAARIGLLVARDPDDETARILAPVKVNIGPHPPALRFRLIGVPGTDVARIAWDDQPVTHSAAGLLAASGGDEQRSVLAEACDWLRGYLALGPRPAADVLADARRDGVAEITLRRARAQLGVRVQREGFGPGSRVLWLLPERPSDDPGHGSPIDDHAPRHDHLLADDHQRENPHNDTEIDPAIGDHPPIDAQSQNDEHRCRNEHLWSVPDGCGATDSCRVLGPCHVYQRNGRCWKDAP